jgi:hypothetical protein
LGTCGPGGLSKGTVFFLTDKMNLGQNVPESSGKICQRSLARVAKNSWQHQHGNRRGTGSKESNFCGYRGRERPGTPKGVLAPESGDKMGSLPATKSFFGACAVSVSGFRTMAESLFHKHLGST